MNALLDGLRSLGAARLLAMGVVAVGMLGLLGILAFHGSSTRMAVLYGDLDLREAGQIAEALDHQHIPHQENASGTQILVASEDVARARLLLAKDGLPSSGSIGYEIFDRGDNLTATQFQQNLNQTRALEGELARTIRTISGVRAARVHLVLPRREPFARERQEAQASVVLTMAGAARLDREGVQAILNLIAAAVPGLRPQNIALIDSRGNLLARAGEPTGPAAAALGTEELRHATELRLARAVEEMLERSLGPGRVRAEASVDMDFEHVQETQEHFDPDGQVVRSSQNVTDNNKSTEQTTSVSVQNNLPNADAGGNGTGTQEQRQEETTNYEISKTVRTLVREQPQIRRISLAVLVDGVEAHGPDGTPIWQPRSPEDLDRIARLVRSAVGYDEKRGDRIEVVNMRFTAEPEPVADDAHKFLGMTLEGADVLRLSQTALFGIIALLTFLLVLRPMVVRLTAPGATGTLSTAALLASGTALPAVPAGDGPALLAGPEGATGELPGGHSGARALIQSSEGERMLRLSNIEGQIRASSIRQLVDLVDGHPDESLAIVRAWMQQEAHQ